MEDTRQHIYRFARSAKKNIPLGDHLERAPKTRADAIKWIRNEITQRKAEIYSDDPANDSLQEYQRLHQQLQEELKKLGDFRQKFSELRALGEDEMEGIQLPEELSADIIKIFPAPEQYRDLDAQIRKAAIEGAQNYHRCYRLLENIRRECKENNLPYGSVKKIYEKVTEGIADLPTASKEERQRAYETLKAKARKEVEIYKQAHEKEEAERAKAKKEEKERHKAYERRESLRKAKEYLPGLFPGMCPAWHEERGCFYMPVVVDAHMRQAVDAALVALLRIGGKRMLEEQTFIHTLGQQDYLELNLADATTIINACELSALHKNARPRNAAVETLQEFSKQQQALRNLMREMDF